MRRVAALAGLWALSAVVGAGCAWLPELAAPAAEADRTLGDARPPRPAASSPPVSLGELAGLPFDQVAALLGEPDLDRAEGEARALLYARDGCALHVFLYPDAAGGTPRVAHAETTPPTAGTPRDQACLDLLLARRAE